MIDADTSKNELQEPKPRASFSLFHPVHSASFRCTPAHKAGVYTYHTVATCTGYQCLLRMYGTTVGAKSIFSAKSILSETVDVNLNYLELS